MFASGSACTEEPWRVGDRRGGIVVVWGDEFGEVLDKDASFNQNGNLSDSHRHLQEKKKPHDFGSRPQLLGRPTFKERMSKGSIITVRDSSQQRPPTRTT